jgi:hypothetical protein
LRSARVKRLGSADVKKSERDNRHKRPCWKGGIFERAANENVLAYGFAAGGQENMRLSRVANTSQTFLAVPREVEKNGAFPQAALATSMARRTLFAPRKAVAPGD